MSRQYTISQLARAAELPTTTVRYYERVGLVEPEERSAGNYRLYSDHSLRKLRFIRAAQAIGFNLGDVRTLLGSRQGSEPPCRDVQGMIEERLADVDRRLADLRHVQRVLMSALEECRATEKVDSCRVLDALYQEASQQRGGLTP